jgi:6-phosphogluconolactonase
MSAVMNGRAGARVRWWVHADARTASEAPAAEVAIRLRTALRMRGLASLAVPGGTTPIAFLDALARYALDWSRVLVTLTDERWVHERHAESNGGLVGRTLHRYAASTCTYRPLNVPGRLVADAARCREHRDPCQATAQHERPTAAVAPLSPRAAPRGTASGPRRTSR